ncbi:MAG: hypothetical protein AAGF75_13125, partial [Cyanobacteria bacterium P01_H01_bin.130]
DSPLSSQSLAEMDAVDTMLIVSVTGLDETLSQTIHARHIYLVSDIKDGMKFTDIMSFGKNGTRILDFTNFHEVEPETHAQYRERKRSPRARRRYLRRPRPRS